MRAKIEGAAHALFAEEDARRWHPADYVAGSTIDGSTVLASVHWVLCPYEGRPAWAQSDAVVAAFREGADYALRTNDDTEAPARRDWADVFIGDLRSRQVPNLGVVGPACAQESQSLLTHDFTHRTHVAIFGFHYPRSLPDWSADDWITIVYRQLGVMALREDVAVVHRKHGRRYNHSAQRERLANLNRETAAGAEVLQEWLVAHDRERLPMKAETATCC